MAKIKHTNKFIIAEAKLSKTGKSMQYTLLEQGTFEKMTAIGIVKKDLELMKPYDVTITINLAPFSYEENGKRKFKTEASLFVSEIQ